MVGRPIVAGYDRITVPVSKFVAHYLKISLSHTNTILEDSLSLIKILETAKFPGDIGLFTVDVVSLYTNIPVDHAIELVEELLTQFPLPNGEAIFELKIYSSQQFNAIQSTRWSHH